MDIGNNMLEDLGKLEQSFYCKKRDKQITNSFEITFDFCNDCHYFDEQDCFVADLEIIDIDEDGDRI